MQQITITGYLSKDAEKRQTQSGKDITNLNVPVKQGWGDNEQTNWFRVAIWGKRAEFASKFRKGEFVTVTGELSIGDYQGKPQYEINASDFHSIRPAPRDNNQGGGQAAGSGGAPANTGGGSNWQAQDLEDDIPFMTADSIY